MSGYILILVWIGIIAFVTRVFDVEHIELVCGEKVKRYSWFFTFVIFLPLIWMAGHRGYFADTSMYIKIYKTMPTNITDLPSYIANQSKDIGFAVISFLIKLIIGNDYLIYLMILATFQGISIVTLFRKYSTNYVLSLFLFVASTDYISWMYNGLRQFTAVSIILFATPFMLKRKYLYVAIFVLLASTMHQSALLMLPFVVIAQGEIWNKKTVLFITGILSAVFFVGQFTNILNDALSVTQYVNVVGDYTSLEDDGTNPVRVVVYSVPAILSFIDRRSLRKENNPLINFCTNMSIITMGLYLLSMVTSGVYLGRLPIYSSLYGYILLPWEAENMFSGSTRRFVYFGIAFCYIAFYYYQMHFTWGVL